MARDGTPRSGTDPADALVTLGGVTLIADGAERRALADRLPDLPLDLPLDGLRHRAYADRPGGVNPV
jgi:hypothetical protein